MHFDCVNGFLNSIKEIIWQTEANELDCRNLYTILISIKLKMKKTSQFAWKKITYCQILNFSFLTTFFLVCRYVRTVTK